LPTGLLDDKELGSLMYRLPKESTVYLARTNGDLETLERYGVVDKKLREQIEQDARFLQHPYWRGVKVFGPSIIIIAHQGEVSYMSLTEYDKSKEEEKKEKISGGLHGS
jgi:hypothetical protein